MADQDFESRFPVGGRKAQGQGQGATPADALTEVEPGSTDSESAGVSALSDEDLSRELSERWAPSDHESGGGLDPRPALAGVVLSLLGLLASAVLLMETLAHAKNPAGTLSCDLSSWISCAASMDSWQSHVLGVPNALIGTIAFAALAALTVALLSRSQLARWIWVALIAGATAALLSVYWFAWQSAFVFGALCPWCMVVWAVTVALFVVLVGRALRASVPGLGWLGRTMVRDWWAFMAIMYALLLVIVMVGLGSQLFG